MSWNVLITTSAMEKTDADALALLRAAGGKIIYASEVCPEELEGIDAVIAGSATNCYATWTS